MPSGHTGKDRARTWLFSRNFLTAAPLGQAGASDSRSKRVIRKPLDRRAAPDFLGLQRLEAVLASGRPMPPKSLDKIEDLLASYRLDLGDSDASPSAEDLDKAVRFLYRNRHSLLPGARTADKLQRYGLLLPKLSLMALRLHGQLKEPGAAPLAARTSRGPLNDRSSGRHYERTLAVLAAVRAMGPGPLYPHFVSLLGQLQSAACDVMPTCGLPELAELLAWQVHVSRWLHSSGNSASTSTSRAGSSGGTASCSSGSSSDVVHVSASTQGRLERVEGPERSHKASLLPRNCPEGSSSGPGPPDVNLSARVPEALMVTASQRLLRLMPSEQQQQRQQRQQQRHPLQPSRRPSPGLRDPAAALVPSLGPDDFKWVAHVLSVHQHALWPQHTAPLIRCLEGLAHWFLPRMSNQALASLCGPLTSSAASGLCSTSEMALLKSMAQEVARREAAMSFEHLCSWACRLAEVAKAALAPSTCGGGFAGMVVESDIKEPYQGSSSLRAFGGCQPALVHQKLASAQGGPGRQQEGAGQDPRSSPIGQEELPAASARTSGPVWAWLDQAGQAFTTFFDGGASDASRRVLDSQRAAPGSSHAPLGLPRGSPLTPLDHLGCPPSAPLTPLDQPGGLPAAPSAPPDQPGGLLVLPLARQLLALTAVRAGRLAAPASQQSLACLSGSGRPSRRGVAEGRPSAMESVQQGSGHQESGSGAADSAAAVSGADTLPVLSACPVPELLSLIGRMVDLNVHADAAVLGLAAAVRAGLPGMPCHELVEAACAMSSLAAQRHRAGNGQVQEREADSSEGWLSSTGVPCCSDRDAGLCPTPGGGVDAASATGQCSTSSSSWGPAAIEAELQSLVLELCQAALGLPSLRPRQLLRLVEGLLSTLPIPNGNLQPVTLAPEGAPATAKEGEEEKPGAEDSLAADKELARFARGALSALTSWFRRSAAGTAAPPSGFDAASPADVADALLACGRLKLPDQQLLAALDACLAVGDFSWLSGRKLLEVMQAMVALGHIPPSGVLEKLAGQVVRSFGEGPVDPGSSLAAFGITGVSQAGAGAMAISGVSDLGSRGRQGRLEGPARPSLEADGRILGLAQAAVLLHSLGHPGPEPYQLIRRVFEASPAAAVSTLGMTAALQELPHLQDLQRVIVRALCSPILEQQEVDEAGQPSSLGHRLQIICEVLRRSLSDPMPWVWDVRVGDDLVAWLVSTLTAWPAGEHVTKLQELVSCLAELAAGPSGRADLSLDVLTEQVYSAVRVGYQLRLPDVPLPQAVAGAFTLVSAAPPRQGKLLAEAVLADVGQRVHELYTWPVDKVAAVLSQLCEMLSSSNGGSSVEGMEGLLSTAFRAIVWRLESARPEALLQLASLSVGHSDQMFKEQLTRQLHAALPSMQPAQLVQLCQVVCPKRGFLSPSRKWLVAALRLRLITVMDRVTAAQVASVLRCYQHWKHYAPHISQAVVAQVQSRPSDFEVPWLIHIAYDLAMIHQSFQLFKPGHIDVLAGVLLTRASSMSLQEMQSAAAIMHMCGRSEDMRALQAQFVRAAQERQQLCGRAGQAAPGEGPAGGA